MEPTQLVCLFVCVCMALRRNSCDHGSLLERNARDACDEQQQDQQQDQQEVADRCAMREGAVLVCLFVLLLLLLVIVVVTEREQCLCL